MAGRVEGYRLNRDELNLELGLGAIQDEVKEQAELITSKWEVPSELPDRPVVLMLGGFQGSGKTTALEILERRHPLLIVSPDEIRHNLFAQNYPFSDEFVWLVNGTKFELVRRGMQIGAHVAIDQAIFPDRIKMVRGILQENYRLISVFLYAPKEELIRRVIERPQVPGRYRGKPEELEASMKKYVERFGEPNMDDYDLSIDVTVNNPDDVAKLIEGKMR